MALVNNITILGQTLLQKDQSRLSDVVVKIWDENQTQVFFETKTNVNGEFEFHNMFDGAFTFTFERGDLVALSIVAIIVPTEKKQTFPPVFLSEEIQPIPEDIFTLSEKRLITGLRAHLKDDDPSKYQLDPPRFRWTDRELLTYLITALADVNVHPPRSSFTIDDVVDPKTNRNILSLVTTGAVFFALLAQASLEMQNQFSYSDNGLSITIQRGTLFQSLAGQVGQAYIQMKKSQKESMYARPASLLPSPIPFRIRTFAPRQYRIR